MVSASGVSALSRLQMPTRQRVGCISKPRKNKSVRRSVIANYAKWSARLYASLKMLIVPYEQISQLVPQTGKVLDVGCGYGILSFFLCFEAPNRQVLGIEPNRARVSAIPKIVKKIPSNVSFRAGDISAIASHSFQCIVMEEVLHHIAKEDQQQVLQQIHGALDDDGTFILRENNKRLSFRYIFVNLPAEYLLYPTEEKGNFRTNSEFESMLGKAGYDVETFSAPWYWFVDISVFVCRKRLASSKVC